MYGGAIRVWIAAAAPGMRMGHSVAALLEQEAAAGIQDAAPLRALRAPGGCEPHRRCAPSWRLRARQADGWRDMGPRRAATPCSNAAGITASLLPYTADASPGKQGRRMAGSGVPIVAPGQAARGQAGRCPGRSPGTSSTRSWHSSRRCTRGVVASWCLSRASGSADRQSFLGRMTGRTGRPVRWASMPSSRALA